MTFFLAANSYPSLFGWSRRPISQRPEQGKKWRWTSRQREAYYLIFLRRSLGEEGNRHSKKKEEKKPAFCWTKNLSAKIDKGESGIKKSKGAWRGWRGLKRDHTNRSEWKRNERCTFASVSLGLRRVSLFLLRLFTCSTTNEKWATALRPSFACKESSTSWGESFFCQDF